MFLPPIFRPDPVAAAFSPAARAVLAHPERVTVYAVEPSPFVSHPRLGFRDALAARRLSPAEAEEATGALYACLRSSDDLMMSCFDPHHGLEFRRGGRWVKVWVCFQCRQTEVEESGRRHVTVGSGLAGRAVLDRLVPKVATRVRRKPAS